MKLDSVMAIVEALNGAGVRYIVVGGLAVIAHGHLRLTKDVDFVIQLVPANIERAFTVLATLGYRPLVPITGEQFADAGNRERWISDKGMIVLQFWSDSHSETPIDVFVTEPFDFEKEYEAALCKSLFNRFEVRVVSLATLIAMKETANRLEDQIDVEQLRMRLDDHERH